MDEIISTAFSTLTSDSMNVVLTGITTVVPLAIPIVLGVLAVKKGISLLVSLVKKA